MRSLNASSAVRPLTTLGQTSTLGSAMPCYAELLGGCRGKISGEHYISRTVLEEFGPTIELSGAAWQEPETKKALGIDNLEVNVLCEQHNSDLSGLDATGGAFTRSLKEAVGPWDTTGSRQVEINGELLERWVLKVMTGALAGRITRRDNERFEWVPDLSWLQRLFGSSEFPPDCGLFVHPKPVSYVHDNAIALQPIWRDGEHCTGGIVRIYGLQLVIFMQSGAQSRLFDRTTGETTHIYRRPRELRFERDQTQHTISLTWSTGGHPNGLRFFQSGPPLNSNP